MLEKIQYRLHIFGNIVGLLLICGILLAAFYEQIFGSALPCPLCYLQRVALISMGFALCLNLSRGPSPFNYGLFGLCSVLLLLVAGRQVLLHILPGDKGYGSEVFGVFPYSWNVLIAIIFVILSFLSIMFQRAFLAVDHVFSAGYKFIVLFFIALVFCNAVSAFLQCGLTACPDNPVSYKYLSQKATDEMQQPANK